MVRTQLELKFVLCNFWLEPALFQLVKHHPLQFFIHLSSVVVVCRGQVAFLSYFHISIIVSVCNNPREKLQMPISQI